jgi:hypothetical protein
MDSAEKLIEEYGVKGALSHLKSQLPSYYVPKALRDEEYYKVNKMIVEVGSHCTHDDVRNECIDYHRRDFGTICNICGKILNSNG